MQLISQNPGSQFFHQIPRYIVMERLVFVCPPSQIAFHVYILQWTGWTRWKWGDKGKIVHYTVNIMTQNISSGIKKRVKDKNWMELSVRYVRYIYLYVIGSKAATGPVTPEGKSNYLFLFTLCLECLWHYLTFWISLLYPCCEFQTSKGCRNCRYQTTFLLQRALPSHHCKHQCLFLFT